MNYAKLLDENSSVFQKRLIGLLDDTVTQSEIADKLNTSRQNVGNWIKGNTAPDIFSLANIADKFNVSTDYLLGRTDIKSTNPETQDIYKYTGLTEEAIEKLKRTREDEDYEYKIVLHYTDKNGVTEVRDTGDLSAYIISKIIEHSKATELLIDIHKYSELLKKQNDFEHTHSDGNDIIIDGVKYEEAQSLINQNRTLFDETGFDVIQLDDYVNSLKWKISRCFEEIVNDIADDIIYEYSVKKLLNEKSAKDIISDYTEELSNSQNTPPDEN